VPEVLLDGEYVGWDSWRDGLTRWLPAFPDTQHHVDRVVAEGDLVAANIRFTCTHQGVLHTSVIGDRGRRPESTIDMREMNFFRLAVGKIVEFWDSWDATAFAQQLGGDQPQATTTT